MRIPALLFSLALGLLLMPRLPAQDPGAQQDAEAAREKLLKAEDELENIQANSETSKTAVDGMKADLAALQSDVTKLQDDNASLRQQLADLQASLDQFKAEQIKARQALIDNVASMMAADKASGKKKKETTDSETKTETSVETQGPVIHPETPSLAPPPDESTTASNGGDAGTGAEATPPPKPQKGYYHVVASGETLTMICNAYRDNGVKVTVSQIRKANGLTEGSVLKAGQKLFIPKPGT